MPACGLRLVDEESGNDFCSGPKQRGPKNEPYNRKCRTDAQSKNDKRVLGIIPGLNSVIPAVEHLENWAHKANQQDQRGKDVRGSRTHRTKYSTARETVAVKGLPKNVNVEISMIAGK